MKSETLRIEKRLSGNHYERGQLKAKFIAGYSLKDSSMLKKYFSLFQSSPQTAWNLVKLKYSQPINTNQPCLKKCIDTKSLFVHIPKAAGISIGMSMYGMKTGDHRKVKDYQFSFSCSDYSKMYKFTFVRNPFDRLYSAYNFLKQGGRNKYDKLFYEKHISKFSNFEDFVCNWVSEENVKKGVHFIPQIDFLTDFNGDININYIGRFESINEDYEKIRVELGIGKKLKSLNITDKNEKNYREKYTEEMKNIVERVYACDLKEFNYNF